jgi:DNA-binding MarR family transcriptional regulator
MICDCTGLTKQTVNSVIRSLKSEGHVTLSPGCEDRREKQVVLTEKGIAYSREVLVPLHELERTVLNIMGSDRVQQMVNDITLFNTVFEKEMEKKRK